MPEVRAYEAVVWVIVDGKTEMKCGMKSTRLDQAERFAAAWVMSSIEEGYVTVSDLDNGRELARVDFPIRAVAAAA